MSTDERIHILIVEDEPVLAMDLGDILEENGYRVIGIASNGQKALDVFQHQRVDLLLCDITIKGEWDGIETVRRLMTLRPVPVIYLTALSDHDTLERAKQTYPAAYLNKPYQLKGLRMAIEIAIHNFKSRNAPVETVPLTATLPTTDREPISRETLLQIGNHLFIKQNYQFIKVDLADLLYLEADNVYTTLVTSTRKYILRLALGSILERINQPGLVRTHRSYAVNVHKIDSFNDTELSIGSQVLPLSRSYKDDFLQQFKLR
ncbi:response regulator [Spirosoma flavum]|uniref:Response regulator n=1 Tax=Spirosoma flavum TaxID=2048557 RepID=A0ABW6AT94_9BACT